jgi:hypothetical protein
MTRRKTSPLGCVLLSFETPGMRLKYVSDGIDPDCLSIFEFKRNFVGSTNQMVSPINCLHSSLHGFPLQRILSNLLEMETYLILLIDW